MEKSSLMKHKSKSVNYSKARKSYLKRLRNDKIIVLVGQISLLLLFFAAAKTVLQVFVLSLPLHIPACIISRIRRETNAQIGIRSAFHSTAPSPVRR